MNRAFLYGDGFFETIWVHDGQVPLFDLHWKRAQNTALKLAMNWPESLTKDLLLSQILSSSELSKFRCRITFFRKGEGHYIPSSNDLDYQIQSSKYELPAFATGIEPVLATRNTDELNKLCYYLPSANAVYYEMHKKNADRFANLKGISSQYYVMAGIHAASRNSDDVVLFNKDMKVAELLLGNIIVVKNNQWYTPGLEEGGVDGVMRAWLLQKFNNITLTPLNKSHLENADLLLGCNALRGLYRLGIKF